MKTPVFVDIHTHYREPSVLNTAETIANGTLAAAEGGIFVTADMPNTPGHETWYVERVDDKIERINRSAIGLVMVHAGWQPTSGTTGELEGMAPDVACLKWYATKTTGNNSEYEAEDFREGGEEWDRVAPKQAIMVHPGEDNLEDFIGLVAVDLQHPLHVAHVNSPDQVKLVKRYKEKDLSITCGVTPHHLLMTSHQRTTRGKFAEMMPPLASQSDTEQLMRMLQDGDIDIIETDYAPHTFEAKMEKECIGGDCFGVPGIEHVTQQLFYQVEQDNLSMERLIDSFSTKPAEILGIKLSKDALLEWDMRKFIIGENDVLSGAGWSQYVGNIAIGKVVTMPAFESRKKYLQRGEIV